MEHLRILPLEIKLDILSRLPTESVLECKLVCKPWRNLVCHSSFSQQHLDHLLHNDSGKSINVIFNADKPRINSSECYWFSYNEENLSPSIRRIDLTPELRSYSIVGSCNGLICLNHESLIVICNPITKEYVTLPKLEKENVTGWKQCLLTGFGYHPVTNEYKVISINLPNSAEVEVYTLGSDGWRNVGKFKGRPGSFLDRLGVFANGALHWVDAGKQAIVTFNLADEKFCDTPLPPISNLSFLRILLDLRVGVLGEYL
ncbi:F-box protein At3g07870-like [Papaver somniferum]|uniref:F-box protein At3g07870-like n=1 Tax=Papaver somniferum TaxID=3469 RepID=UPI000E7009A2|nr:F-box protein At3g07870-like [Papaver somniferum]